MARCARKESPFKWSGNAFLFSKYSTAIHSDMWYSIYIVSNLKIIIFNSNMWQPYRNYI